MSQAGIIFASGMMVRRHIKWSIGVETVRGSSRSKNRFILRGVEFFYRDLTRPAGFEPATYGLGNRCSVLLSYGRPGAHHTHFRRSGSAGFRGIRISGNYAAMERTSLGRTAAAGRRFRATSRATSAAQSRINTSAEDDRCSREPTKNGINR